MVCAGVDNWRRGNMQHTGDTIVPARGEELSAETLFRLELIELDHQIGKRRRIARQAMQIDPLERLAGVEVVSEGACDVLGLSSGDQGNSQAVHLNIGGHR